MLGWRHTAERISPLCCVSQPVNMCTKRQVALGLVARAAHAGQRPMLLVILVAGLAGPGVTLGQSMVNEPEFVEAVQADWAAQEQRAGRSAGSVESVCAALQRGDRLLEDFLRMSDGPRCDEDQVALQRLLDEAAGIEQMSEAARLALYHQIRWTLRELALKNPLLAGKPIVFLQRQRFICQMLHEYIGYYYNYANLAGGGVFVLERAGAIRSETRDLSTDSCRAVRTPRRPCPMTARRSTSRLPRCATGSVPHRTGYRLDNPAFGRSGPA